MDLPFVSSRRFGVATVTLISEGTFRWNLELPVPEPVWRQAMPEADADGAIELNAHVAHIRLGAASILVDPGFGDPGEDASWLDGLARTPGLIAGLRSIDVTPDQITHVLITHTHDDHIAGLTVEHDGERVPRFPHARHFLGRADWEDNPNREDPASTLALHIGTVARLGLLDLVDGDREIVPGVTMIAAPGESPGHSIVRVDGGGAVCYLLGDLFHHGCEVAHPDWMSPWREPVPMHASRDRLFAAAVPIDATLVFAHERFPGWGHIVPTGTGYAWKRLE
jgi:glyoxylase-like metal-dependent hydrolase (beta-lactamase superfamily II)